MSPPAHTTYFWLSVTGAILLALVFGLALPRLFFLVVRNVSWAKPSRALGSLSVAWLLGVGGAWSFDAYCQWFGLTNEQSVMLFLWSLVLAATTYYGFRHYRALSRLVTKAHLDQEKTLLRVVQRVSLGGFFVSEPEPTGKGWVIVTANRAACAILGYEFRTLFDNALIGQVGADLVPEDLREKIHSYGATKGVVKYLTQLLRRDGSRAWVEVSAETVDNYHGKPVRVTYFADVTIHMEKNRELADQVLMGRLLKELDGHVVRLTANEESTI